MFYTIELETSEKELLVRACMVQSHKEMLTEVSRNVTTLIHSKLYHNIAVNIMKGGTQFTDFEIWAMRAAITLLKSELVQIALSKGHSTPIIVEYLGLICENIKLQAQTQK